MALSWYVLRTKPNAEWAADERLGRQGFERYLPLLRTVIAIRGKKAEREWPLFRGYMFVRFDMEGDPGRMWAKINNTRAVISLLPSAQNPIEIPTHEVEKLRAYQVAGAFRRGSGAVFQPGQRLRALRGVLADMALTVLDCDDDGRLRVLWDCLGAQRVVRLPLEHVTVW